METRELICIGCPLGCNLKVTLNNGEVTEVNGNTCPNGEKYAKKECTNPTRIVTSSVRVKGGKLAMVSCKTKEDIPKRLIFDVANALESVVMEAPVAIGDVVLADVCQTGVDVIATKNVEVK